MKRFAFLCLLLTVCSGCQNLLHEMQPHRLWRLNYHDPPGRTDGVLYSVSDPLDEPVGASPAR